MSRSKYVIFAILSAFLGLAGLLLLAEIALRFLPVHSRLQAQPVDAGAPVFRLEPDRPFTYSKGCGFSIVNTGRINNLGFVNDQDYEAAGTPLLAVVGDSYVEALMVPYPLTLQGRLAGRLGGRGRVYSFAASGAPLSQYLAYAEYARDNFRPSLLVVVIVANDFDESLANYGLREGFHYFARGRNGSLALQRADYRPGWLRTIARSSALARYLALNCQIAEAARKIAGFITGDGAKVRFVGNTAADAAPERLDGSKRVVERFLAELPARAGLDPSRIVLVVDGVRPELYDDAALRAVADSYIVQMREFLLPNARRAGYTIIDMQPRFIARYRRDGSRAEFPIDAHWSAVGHEEAAAAVAETAAFRKFTDATGALTHAE